MDKKQIKLVGTMTLGPKGQVVIPADVREMMNVKPGDKMIALYSQDKQIVGFSSEENMQVFINKMGSHFDALRQQISSDSQ